MHYTGWLYNEQASGHQGNKFDSSLGGTPDCTVVAAGFACNSRINRLWTGGAKVGYAFGNWMVYGAGGYANGRIEENTTFAGVVGSLSKANHGGWYAGAGFDWYVTRIWYSDLILGLEYRHIELDDKLHNNAVSPAFNGQVGRPQRIGMQTAARVSHRCDVIDVNAKPQRPRLSRRRGGCFEFFSE